MKPCKHEYQASGKFYVCIHCSTHVELSPRQVRRMKRMGLIHELCGVCKRLRNYVTDGECVDCRH